MMTYSIETNVNGRPRAAEVTARDTLLDVLRDHWDVFEVKNGCEQGDCGVCTVIFKRESGQRLSDAGGTGQWQRCCDCKGDR